MKFESEKKPQVTAFDLFQNTQPLELEIGCGKGRFLLARAEAEPGINFLGIDWAKKWLEVGAGRSGKKNLTNLKFVRTHAEAWVADLQDEQISVVHIYFSDPWPKRRHHKRRVVRPDFLTVLHRKLVPEGVIHVATDHQGYWKDIEKTVAETAALWKDVRSAGERFAYPEFETNYEIKYAAQGRPLHYLALRKKI